MLTGFPSYLLAVMLSLFYQVKFISNRISCRFDIHVNEFLAPDPKKVNWNVFEAFSDNPITYIDQNGKAPESALQILRNHFGNQNEHYFRSFNAYFTYGNVEAIFGRVNSQYVSFYNEINAGVDALIRNHMDQIFPPGNNIPQLGVDVYTSGTRAIQSNLHRRPRSVPLEETYFRNAELPSFHATSHFLSEQSIEMYLESSGHGQRIFEEERRFWRAQSPPYTSMYLPPTSELYEGRPIFEVPQRRILTAEELAVLYEHPNFQYSEELRGFLNYYSMPRPWAFPSELGRQVAYQNYRRRIIRIQGAQNTEVVVPFQRLRFQPL